MSFVWSFNMCVYVDFEGNICHFENIVSLMDNGKKERKRLFNDGTLKGFTYLYIVLQEARVNLLDLSLFHIYLSLFHIYPYIHIHIYISISTYS